MISGSPEYVKLVKASLAAASASNPEIKQMIDGLKNSKNTHEIKNVDEAHMVTGNENVSTGNWRNGENGKGTITFDK